MRFSVVCNLAIENISIIPKNFLQDYFELCRHGVRQLRTGWYDGPAYITQCPIQPGQSYVYNFTLTGQRGTLLWHAHISWLRATVHGAIVILPKRSVPYPFPKADKEKIIVFGKLIVSRQALLVIKNFSGLWLYFWILGEWWKADVEAVINQATQMGAAPNISDAHTINGHPGPVTNCTSQGTDLGHTWSCDA